MDGSYVAIFASFEPIATPPQSNDINNTRAIIGRPQVHCWMLRQKPYVVFLAPLTSISNPRVQSVYGVSQTA